MIFILFIYLLEPTEQELEYRRILEEQKRELEKINQVLELKFR